MRKTVDIRVVMLATLFGFLGGALASIALPGLVFAQDDPAERITAREFRLVDEEGNVLGILGAAPGPPPRVVLREKGATSVPQLSQGKIMLFDSDGNTVWFEPRNLVHPLTSGANP